MRYINANIIGTSFDNLITICNACTTKLIMNTIHIITVEDELFFDWLFTRSRNKIKIL